MPCEYVNNSFGYTLNRPCDWRLDVESGGLTAFVQRQGVASIEILAETIQQEWSLGEFVENYRQRLTSQGPGWQHFRETRVTGEFRGGINYVHLEFRRQVNPGDCVENVVTHLYRSRYFPAKLQGFAVSMSICEDNLRRYDEQREATLNSFAEFQAE